MFLDFTKSLPCKLNVHRAYLLCLLLETMKDMDRFRKSGYVEHAVFATGVNADFLDARSYGSHGAEIVGILARLHQIQLVSSLLPCIVRKCPQVL